MIAYLRFPVTVRTQESMLKHEKALAELDAAVDDWASMLKEAETRRTCVNERLLQHMAAVLSLDSHSSNDAPTDTPNVSGELGGPEWSERKDVESIKIYADSDTCALLADIEKEICVNMDREESMFPGMDPGAPETECLAPLITGR